MPTLVVTDTDIHNQIINEAETYRKNHKYEEAIKSYMELARMANHEFAFEEQEKFIKEAQQCIFECMEWLNQPSTYLQWYQLTKQRY